MLSLDAANRDAYGFISSHAQHIDSLFTPLKTYLQMTSLSYVRHFRDGRFIFLINGFEEYVGQYLSEIEEEGPTFTQMMRECGLNQHRHYIWPKSFGNDNAMQLRHHHNRWNGMSIVHRDADFVEMIHFSFNRDTEDKTNFFLNNLSVLNDYFRYFKSAIGHIMQSSKEHLAVYRKTPDLSCVSQDDQATQLMKYVLDQGFLVRTREGMVRLSAREVECIRMLSYGKSAKEIARALDVSIRTIDTYLSRARFKTHTSSKSELIRLLSV